MELFSVLIFVLLQSATVFAQSTMITFDDYPHQQDITNGYGGLNWNNFAAVNGITDPVGFGFGRNTGYTHGIVSGSQGAYNPDGTPAYFSSPTPFMFNSIYLTSAWPDNTQFLIQGFIGGTNGTLVDTLSLSLSTLSPTYENLDWSGIDTIAFSSIGSPPSQIVMDNLTYTVPEQSTLSLLTLPIVALIFKSCSTKWLRLLN